MKFLVLLATIFFSISNFSAEKAACVDLAMKAVKEAVLTDFAELDDVKVYDASLGDDPYEKDPLEYYFVSAIAADDLYNITYMVSITKVKDSKACGEIKEVELVDAHF